MMTGTQGDFTKQIPANKVGGEVWDDITSLFTPGSFETEYELHKNNASELIGNIPLRITIETARFGSGSSDTTGTIQLCVTAVVDEVLYLLTNTIYLTDSESFTGILYISSDYINYEYGFPIEETERPKILKVERLV